SRCLFDVADVALHSFLRCIRQSSLHHDIMPRHRDLELDQATPNSARSDFLLPAKFGRCGVAQVGADMLAPGTKRTISRAAETAASATSTRKGRWPRNVLSQRNLRVAAALAARNGGAHLMLVNATI